MAKRGSIQYPEFLGVNLSEEQAQALDRLAEETCRTCSDVVRFLINRAGQLIGEEIPADAAVVGGGE
jgi:predicted transcriptional regulator